MFMLLWQVKSPLNTGLRVVNILLLIQYLEYLDKNKQNQNERTGMKKTVYVVNHGQKELGANPGTTIVGDMEIAALKPLIPANPAAVYCGAGKRHLGVCHALGLESDKVMFTPSIGGPESLEKINGRDMVILADGTTVPLENFPVGEDRTAAMLAVLGMVPDNTVICAGRPAMIALGVKDAKSAAVYRVDIYCQGITGSLTLENLRIQEVKATGVAEAGTV
jgi:hypothetical protein